MTQGDEVIVTAADTSLSIADPGGAGSRKFDNRCNCACVSPPSSPFTLPLPSALEHAFTDAHPVCRAVSLARHILTITVARIPLPPYSTIGTVRTVVREGMPPLLAFVGAGAGERPVCHVLTSSDMSIIVKLAAAAAAGVRGNLLLFVAPAPLPSRCTPSLRSTLLLLLPLRVWGYGAGLQATKGQADIHVAEPTPPPAVEKTDTIDMGIGMTRRSSLKVRCHSSLPPDRLPSLTILFPPLSGSRLPHSLLLPPPPQKSQAHTHAYMYAHINPPKCTQSSCLPIPASSAQFTHPHAALPARPTRACIAPDDIRNTQVASGRRPTINLSGAGRVSIRLPDLFRTMRLHWSP